MASKRMQTVFKRFVLLFARVLLAISGNIYPAYLHYFCY